MAPTNKLKSNNKVVRNPEHYYFQPYTFNHICTEAPKIFTGQAYPQFETICSTRDHIYVFYFYHYEHAYYRLARFCKVTHTWESGNMILPRASFGSCMLWNNTTVLLFDHNRLRAINLETRIVERIETQSMLVPVEGLEMVINVNQDLKVEWYGHTIDNENQHLYVQCRLKIGVELGPYVVYRLDWATKVWTKLPMPATDAEQVPKGAFMAYLNGQLFIGIEDFRSSPNTYYRNKFVYNRVARFDLNTNEWSFPTIAPYVIGRRNIRFAIRANIKWTQVGSKMYCISAYDNPEQPSKNDLWTIDLPTLTWTRHQELAKLPAPMKTFCVCGTKEAIWALGTRRVDYSVESLRSERLNNDLINIYKISLNLPNLQTLARDAFLYRPPYGLRYRKQVQRRKSGQKWKLVVYRKCLEDQDLNVELCKQFLEEEGYHAAMFKLSSDSEIVKKKI